MLDTTTTPADLDFTFADVGASAKASTCPRRDVRKESTIAQRCHAVARRIDAIEIEMRTGERISPAKLSSSGDIDTVRLGRVVRVRMRVASTRVPVVEGEVGSWSGEILPRDARRDALLDLESKLLKLETAVRDELRVSRSTPAAPARELAVADEFFSFARAV